MLGKGERQGVATDGKGGGAVEVTQASGWWPGAWGPIARWGLEEGSRSGREAMRSVWTVEVEFPERCPGGESSKIWVEKGLALMD